MADVAKISHEAMAREVEKARKRRLAREKKKQEAIDLAPVKALQPKSRTIRYDNMKSAMAEERILAQAAQEPSLLEKARDLTPEMFSSPLLGKVFGQMMDRYRQGLEVSLGVLTDLNQEEMSHVAGILGRHEDTVHEQAFVDCVRTVRGEHQVASVSTEDDLRAYQDQLRKRKGINP